jgi:glutathione peroxidase
MSTDIYSFNLKTITGENKSLADYKGKVLLIVNVASKCGLTPQYEGLESLYKEYKSYGLEILGFPANEFYAQEPGADNEIQDFCRSTYGVEFPMFSKIVVKGQGQHPLYKYLTETKQDAVMLSGGKLMSFLESKNLLTGNPYDIKWNFEKFLINKEGKIIGRFAPDITPQDPGIVNEIKKALEA